MLVELSIAWVITLNVAGWLAIQLGFAWAFTKMTATWFNPGNVFCWEHTVRFYERVFRIKDWKDRLPDRARWFGGGFEKGALASRNRDCFQRFIRETRRGELCHWAAIASAPVFVLWNPWWGDTIILAQRYNRARFQKLLAKGSKR